MSLHNMNAFRTLAIETDMAWPDRERTIVFRGHTFQLLPSSTTRERMIRVQTTPDFLQVDADRLIGELLSALSWSEQKRALPGFGMWTSLPIDIGRGQGECTGTGHFDYVPDPPSAEAKLALALYREGLSVNLTQYQFLAFFKIINIRFQTGKQQKQWIRDNLHRVSDKTALTRIADMQKANLDVPEYLYGSGRCAVAHAYDPQQVVNPDEPEHLLRLFSDLPVIQELARIAIEVEFGVQSKDAFYDEHLYELEGFRKLLGPDAVTGVKSARSIDLGAVPFPEKLSLRLRDREQVPLFEQLCIAALAQGAGVVKLTLGDASRRMVVFVTLDFKNERLWCDPLSDVHIHDDGTPDAAKVLLDWCKMYEWWFGANGLVEIWDSSTESRLGRSQYYIPPVNSRFPEEEWNAYREELLVRVAKST